MAERAAQAPSARREIVRALSKTVKGVPVSATPKYLASELGLPARVVRDELEMMGRELVVASRVIRSGDVLYRLRDAQDPKWDAFRSVSLNLN